jgi:hypothetical protein
VEERVGISHMMYLVEVLDLVKVFGCETPGCLGEALGPWKGFCLFHILLICAMEDCFRMCKMTLSLRERDRLDGNSNFVS